MHTCTIIIKKNGVENDYAKQNNIENNYQRKLETITRPSRSAIQYTHKEITVRKIC